MTQALSLAAIGLLGWAALSDIATRRIPNRMVGALAMLGLARVAADLAAGGAAGAALADLALGLAVLAGGAWLFHLRVLGGGDVKLLAAAALWLGAGRIAPFLASTALAGGALALGFVIWCALRRGASGRRPSLPYGVAIAAGALLGTLPVF